LILKHYSNNKTKTSTHWHRFVLWCKNKNYSTFFTINSKKNGLLMSQNKKIPTEARIFKNQKPKFMKPFTCSHSATGLYDKNRCKNTFFLEYASPLMKKIDFLSLFLLTETVFPLIFAT
jgi:hypothetical protein